MKEALFEKLNSSVEVSLLDNGNLLKLDWLETSSRFHAIWLRDNGQDNQSRDNVNFQKLLTLQDIPADTAIKSAVVQNENRLVITFNPDNWRTTINLGWLWKHRYDNFVCERHSIVPDTATTWGAEFVDSLHTTSFDQASTNAEALLDWLCAIDRYGVALMEGLPQKNAAVLDVIGLFGYVRETNYGRYFEIRTEINPINLAYTSLGLQSHTDNPYRDPVPGLQFFGCLENSTDGGESIVVDGFKAAEVLKSENPEAYNLLSSYCANFEYHGNNDVYLKTSKPMIECAVDGTITCIRFNNRSCDALTDIDFHTMEAYYNAYRQFGELIGSTELSVIFKLKPGQLFVTDNTRVLHGRTAFSGSGKRWMQGAYADKDALKSKIQTLREKVL